MTTESTWYTPYELGYGLVVRNYGGGFCDDLLRSVEEHGGQDVGDLVVDLHEEDGLLVVPCLWDGTCVDLVGNMSALASVMSGKADSLALTVRGGDIANDVALPRLLLCEDDFLESDTYRGYYESPRIAYRSCIMSCTLWRSGNDGVWKDSWKTSYVGDDRLVDDNTFWDDVGSCEKTRPLADAMGLADKGLAKCMHYVDLDPTLERVRQQARHAARRGRPAW
jgi:hypothetical protein